MRKTILILALVILTGMVAAQPSGNSGLVKPGFVPGDLFYPVEQGVERLEVGLASVIGGPELRAKVMANNAEERLSEAQVLMERNRSDRAARMVEKYERTINQSRENARKSGNAEIEARIDNVSEKHLKVLEDVKRKVPEPAKAGIQRAIDNSRKKSPSTRKNDQSPDEQPRSEPGSQEFSRFRGKKTDNSDMTENITEELESETSTSGDGSQPVEDIEESVTGQATGQERRPDTGTSENPGNSPVEEAPLEP